MKIPPVLGSDVRRSGAVKRVVGLGVALVVVRAMTAVTGCTLGDNGSASYDASFPPFDAQGGDDAAFTFDALVTIDAPVRDQSAPIDAGTDATLPVDDSGLGDGSSDASPPSDVVVADAPIADAVADADADANADADADAEASDAAIIPDAVADAGDTSSPDAVAPPTGCADGTREGFLSSADYPTIAACAGGWSVPGVTGTPVPACLRGAGNDSANPAGTGCSAADLCATGWHVCAQASEVAGKSATGCAGAAADGGALVFYASGQSGSGNATCGVGSNDVFGCGTLGESPAADCSPLDRFSDDLCSVLGSPWVCGTDETHEADYVTKTDSTAGGILCCSDP